MEFTYSNLVAACTGLAVSPEKDFPDEQSESRFCENAFSALLNCFKTRKFAIIDSMAVATIWVPPNSINLLLKYFMKEVKVPGCNIQTGLDYFTVKVRLPITL